MDFIVVNDDDLEEIYFNRLKNIKGLKKCKNHMEQLIQIQKIMKKKNNWNISMCQLIKYYDWIHYMYRIVCYCNPSFFI